MGLDVPSVVKTVENEYEQFISFEGDISNLHLDTYDGELSGEANREFHIKFFKNKIEAWTNYPKRSWARLSDLTISTEDISFRLDSNGVFGYLRVGKDSVECNLSARSLFWINTRSFRNVKNGKFLIELIDLNTLLNAMASVPSTAPIGRLLKAIMVVSPFYFSTKGFWTRVDPLIEDLIREFYSVKIKNGSANIRGGVETDKSAVADVANKLEPLYAIVRGGDYAKILSRDYFIEMSKSGTKFITVEVNSMTGKESSLLGRLFTYVDSEPVAKLFNALSGFKNSDISIGKLDLKIDPVCAHVTFPITFEEGRKVTVEAKVENYGYVFITDGEKSLKLAVSRNGNFRKSGREGYFSEELETIYNLLLPVWEIVATFSSESRKDKFGFIMSKMRELLRT